MFGFFASFMMTISLFLIYKYPLVQNDLIIFMMGQVSVVFVLVFRHVFKSGFKIE